MADAASVSETTESIALDDLGKATESVAETRSDQERHHLATRTFELDYDGSNPPTATQTGVEGRDTLAQWLSKQMESARAPIDDTSTRNPVGTSARMRLALFDLSDDLWKEEECGSFGEATEAFAGVHMPSLAHAPEAMSAILPLTLEHHGISNRTHQAVRTQFFSCNEISMVWKNYPESRTTVGLVWIPSEYQRHTRDFILGRLESQQLLLSHPSLLPLVTLQVSIDIVRQVISCIRRQVLNAQKRSGFRNLCSVAPMELAGFVDFSHLPGLVGGETTRLAEQERQLRGFEDALLFIQEQNKVFRRDHSALGNDIEHIAQHVDGQLDFSSWECTALLYDVRSLQSQASIVAEGISNLIGQQEKKQALEIANDLRAIAEDGRRDSASMKAIAAVTMCFLPGTYLATFFAMPMFQKPDIIMQEVWFYWLVTALLTILVVGVWLFWNHWSAKHPSRTRYRVHQEESGEDMV
ncbi:hypothetical protein QBC47DRAFT_370650 [Echria macrotheca]|uniref:Uncharacterized protein n=1 Tax=Echria macrotheca TaxID=438768 RepID=A0AAJ0FCZ4_9PEZI|nr:hypothetical protein QBC47DRAFT_370650 [Echria macrotheca]